MKLLFTLSMLLLCAISFTEATAQIPPDTTNLYWTSGLRMNQGKAYGMIGVTKQIGTRILLYGGTDLGGDNLAVYTQALYRITPRGRLELYAALGPQWEKVQQDLTPDIALEAITLATGAVVTFDPSPSWSTWAGITYLNTDADIYKWKFGIGLAFPFKL